MGILNYTTTVSVDKTTTAIQGILRNAGARAVLSEYDDDGLVEAISFRIQTKQGMLSFRLPARFDGVYKRLVETAPPRYRSREQACRVTWRIIKDWIEAQLAIIEAEQAELAEVFLPYLQDPETGRTVYDKMQAAGFKWLTHQSGGNHD